MEYQIVTFTYTHILHQNIMHSMVVVIPMIKQSFILFELTS
jgi:hypothetical protein